MIPPTARFLRLNHAYPKHTPIHTPHLPPPPVRRQNWQKSVIFGIFFGFLPPQIRILLPWCPLRKFFSCVTRSKMHSGQRSKLSLTAHNWQKWKRVFLTCPCHEIYRDKAVRLKSCKYTFKKYDSCEYVEFGAISCFIFHILSITA